MAITYDPVKRAATLRERGLDFEDAAVVFSRFTLDFIDDRHNYGETRIVSAGFLRDRLVIVVWTQRSDNRHIISMRKANDRERTRYEGRVLAGIIGS